MICSICYVSFIATDKFSLQHRQTSVSLSFSILTIWITQFVCNIDEVIKEKLKRAKAVRDVKVVKAAMREGFIFGNLFRLEFYLGSSCALIDPSPLFSFYFNIFAGGKAVLVHASKELDKLQMFNSYEKIGVQLLQNALDILFFDLFHFQLLQNLSDFKFFFFFQFDKNAFISLFDCIK